MLSCLHWIEWFSSLGFLPFSCSLFSFLFLTKKGGKTKILGIFKTCFGKTSQYLCFIFRACIISSQRFHPSLLPRSPFVDDHDCYDSYDVRTMRLCFHLFASLLHIQGSLCMHKKLDGQTKPWEMESSLMWHVSHGSFRCFLWPSLSS